MTSVTKQAMRMGKAPLVRSNGVKHSSDAREKSFAVCDSAFSARWRCYLLKNFRGGPKQIAGAFGVTQRTAEYWLSETSEPRGRHVVSAMLMHPHAIPTITGEI